MCFVSEAKGGEWHDHESARPARQQVTHKKNETTNVQTGIRPPRLEKTEWKVTLFIWIVLDKLKQNFLSFKSIEEKYEMIINNVRWDDLTQVN